MPAPGRPEAAPPRFRVIRQHQVAPVDSNSQAGRRKGAREENGEGGREGRETRSREGSRRKPLEATSAQARRARQGTETRGKTGAEREE